MRALANNSRVRLAGKSAHSAPPAREDFKSVEELRSRLDAYQVPSRIRGSFGAVAQLVRVLDCRSSGCGFKSRPPRLAVKLDETARPISAGFFVSWESRTVPIAE